MAVGVIVDNVMISGVDVGTSVGGGAVVGSAAISVAVGASVGMAVAVGRASSVCCTLVATAFMSGAFCCPGTLQLVRNSEKTIINRINNPCFMAFLLYPNDKFIIVYNILISTTSSFVI